MRFLYLDRQFSHMLMKLDQLIKTNYIQQLENKEAQLRNLQLQINPHFLYNTLETISSIAAVKQAFVVCDMCQKLVGFSDTVSERITGSGNAGAGTGAYAKLYFYSENPLRQSSGGVL